MMISGKLIEKDVEGSGRGPI